MGHDIIAFLIVTHRARYKNSEQRREIPGGRTQGYHSAPTELRNELTHMKDWAAAIVMFCNGKAQNDVLPLS